MGLRSVGNTTVGAVVDAIREVTGVDVPVDFDEARAINDLVASSGRWATPARWSPQADLQTGIQATWLWMLARGPA